MKKAPHYPRQRLHARTVLRLLLTVLTLATAGSAYSEVRPSPHELGTIATTSGPRLWFHEEEFTRDPLLRASPDHVAILHLEPGGKHGNRLRNIIPYFFDETAPYNFCVPDDDPHIQSLELVREGSKAVVVHVPRSSRCKTRTVEAGFYQMVIEHDGQEIEAAGKKAFVHVPRAMSTLLADGTLSPFPSACDPDFSDTLHSNNPIYTFTVPNGRFVSIPNATPNVVQTTTKAEVLFTGWFICPDGSGNVLLRIVISTPQQRYLSSSGPPSTDTTFNITTTPTPFKLTDLGNGQFTLAANFSGTLYPIVVGTDTILRWATPGTTPTVFSIVLKFYGEGVTAPSLQQGEVALFRRCNYNIFDRGTAIFTTNVQDLSPFTFVFQEFNNAVGSVKVGPQTNVLLYPNANYGGQVQVIAEDTPCLNGTPIGSGTSSFQITPYRDFFVATDACQNCNLSGLDLSGLNLAGGQFQGTTFTGANLTNTDLRSASLNNANVNGATTLLTGTNFLGAIIRCANFSGADLSQATFQLSGLVAPIVTTDFSCRVDLTGATLDLSTFPLTQWRYFNLTGAKINDLTGATLSTTASPLNLSGVILNSANLRGAKLDGANLGCATTADDTEVCSQLSDANLNSASLRKASLVSAILQGANLDGANLDSANLCSAFLDGSAHGNSANLDGAYLRNVNLMQARLTGASLKNANFYSTVAKTSCLSTNCGPTASCASAVDAVLNNATFTGAYLSGVDFSGATPQSVDFSNAFLVGANFTNANLSRDLNTGRKTSFSGAYLQGATFTNANVAGANFHDAHVSTERSMLVMQLNCNNLDFSGYQPSSGSAPGCVQFSVSHGTVVPPTDNANICPDGSSGSCGASPLQWPAPEHQPPPPVSCTPPEKPPVSCTSAHSDLNWIISPP